MEMTVYKDETLDGELMNQFKQSDRLCHDELKLLDLLRIGDNLIG